MPSARIEMSLAIDIILTSAKEPDLKAIVAIFSILTRPESVEIAPDFRDLQVPFFAHRKLVENSRRTHFFRM